MPKVLPTLHLSPDVGMNVSAPKPFRPSWCTPQSRAGHTKRGQSSSSTEKPSCVRCDLQMFGKGENRGSLTYVEYLEETLTKVLFLVMPDCPWQLKQGLGSHPCCGNSGDTHGRLGVTQERTWGWKSTFTFRLCAAPGAVGLAGPLG